MGKHKEPAKRGQGRPPKDGKTAMSNAERQARRKDRVDAMAAQLEWLATWVDRTLREVEAAEERLRKTGQSSGSLYQVRSHVSEMQTRLRPGYIDYLTALRTKWRHEKASRNS